MIAKALPGWFERLILKRDKLLLKIIIALDFYSNFTAWILRSFRIRKYQPEC